MYSVNVHFDDGIGPEKEELKEATDFFIDQVSILSVKPRKKVGENFEGLSDIHWTKDPIVDNGNEKTLGVYIWPNTIKVMWRHNCIGRTAYFHEVGHHIEKWLTGYKKIAQHSSFVWNDIIHPLEKRWRDTGGHISCSDQL